MGYLRSAVLWLIMEPAVRHTETMRETRRQRSESDWDCGAVHVQDGTMSVERTSLDERQVDDFLRNVCREGTVSVVTRRFKRQFTQGDCVCDLRPSNGYRRRDGNDLQPQ